MKRKVAKIGPATLMISLPSKWVKTNHIKKGQEVDVSDEGSKLIVDAGEPDQVKRAVLKLDTPKDASAIFLKHQALTVKHLYRLGVDEIKIEYNDPKLIREIQKQISKQILGFEVIGQKDKYCLIKNIAKGLDSEFDSLLRRLFLVTMSMGTDAYDAIAKKDSERLTEIAMLERTNNKLTNLCERLLNKYGYKDVSYTSVIYALVRELEQMADTFRNLCNFVKETKIKVNKEFMASLKSVNDLFRELYDQFYQYEVSKSIKHKEHRDVLQKECTSKLKTAKGGNGALYHFLVVAITKINHMGESVRVV